jgi:hypothetical protein
MQKNIKLSKTWLNNSFELFLSIKMDIGKNSVVNISKAFRIIILGGDDNCLQSRKIVAIIIIKEILRKYKQLS